MNNNLYKLYQLMNFFITKFSYTNVLIKGLVKNNEIWLANKTNPDYQIIRLSTDTLDQSAIDKERISEYIVNVNHFLKIDKTGFIDVHIGNEEVLDNEAFNSVVMDSQFYSGTDITSTFPGFKNVIHDVDNEDAEISTILQSIGNEMRRKQNNSRRKLIPELAVTYAVIALCVLNFFLFLGLNTRYSQSASLIFLGADYKMFTLGCREFFRLITSAFLHGSFLHLFMNMYAIYSLGRHYERRFGHLKFACMLLTGILTGSLTFGLLSTNSFGIGLSGGLYCLFAYYILEVWNNGYYTNNSFITLILVNIMINFLPSTAWQAHLGGAVAGALFYYIFEVNKANSRIYIPLIIIMLTVMGYKYVSQNKISPQYAGTDSEVLKIMTDFGFDSYAEKTAEKLLIQYLK